MDITIKGVEGQSAYRNTLGISTVLELLHENLERAMSYRSYGRDAALVREIKALEVVVEHDEDEDSLQAKFNKAQRDAFAAQAPFELSISGHKAKQINEQLETTIRKTRQRIRWLWSEIEICLRWPELFNRRSWEWVHDKDPSDFPDQLTKAFQDNGIPDSIIRSGFARRVKRLRKELSSEVTDQRKLLAEREIVARCKS